MTNASAQRCTPLAMATQSSPHGLDHNILDIREAIYASQMVLTYCSQRGIEIERRDLQTFIDARRVYDGEDRDGLTPELEVQFWGSLNRTMTVIAPVTIESLAASLGTYDYASSAHKLPEIPAERAVRRYRRLAIMMLLLLLGVQGYMDWGRTSASRIEAGRAEYLDVDDEIREYTAAKGYEDTVTAATDPSYERLVQQRNNIEAKIAHNFGTLRSWSFWQLDAGKGPKLIPYRRYVIDQDKMAAGNNEDALAALERQEESAKSDMAVSELLVTAGLVLSMLQGYVLPLLYGLVGAALQVLRSLRHQVDSYTYSKASELSFRIHLALGTLAGMSVGWLLGADGLVQTGISSFALAFVAGYSVEVLFGMLDGLIKRAPQITTPSPKLTSTPTTQQVAANG